MFGESSSTHIHPNPNLQIIIHNRYYSIVTKHILTFSLMKHSMSRSTAVLITFLMMLGIAILALACGSNKEPQPVSTITQVDKTIDTISYPYTWDTAHYDRIISCIQGEATSLDYDITITFNEEFIEITNNEFDSYEDNSVIFIGHWTNKYTFVIDNNFGVATVNLKTGFMTINYNDGKKEIYTH